MGLPGQGGEGMEGGWAEGGRQENAGFGKLLAEEVLLLSEMAQKSSRGLGNVDSRRRSDPSM